LSKSPLRLATDRQAGLNQLEARVRDRSVQPLDASAIAAVTFTVTRGALPASAAAIGSRSSGSTMK
jgi:hypothetical protein